MRQTVSIESATYQRCQYGTYEFLIERFPYNAVSAYRLVRTTIHIRTIYFNRKYSQPSYNAVSAYRVVSTVHTSFLQRSFHITRLVRTYGGGGLTVFSIEINCSYVDSITVFSIKLNCSYVDSEVAVVQQVVCWLIRRKARVLESQARHQNEIRKVFLRRFPLSRFLAKTLRVNRKLS